MVTWKKLVLFFVFYGQTCLAATFTEEYSWTTPSTGWNETDGRPVIVRIFSNGVEICTKYTNMTNGSATVVDCTFDHDIGRGMLNAQAEYSPGHIWTAGRPYTVGEVVMPTSLLLKDYRHFVCNRDGTSGGTEPDWPVLDGETIDDPDAGGAGWTVVDTVVEAWQPNTTYAEGDMVIPSTNQLSGNGVYVCTRAGDSGATEPDWTAEVKLPWWRFYRFFQAPDTTIDDPDSNGAGWKLGKRDTSGPSNTYMQFFESEDGTSSKVGRSMN